MCSSQAKLRLTLLPALSIHAPMKATGLVPVVCHAHASMLVWVWVGDRTEAGGGWRGTTIKALPPFGHAQPS